VTVHPRDAERIAADRARLADPGLVGHGCDRRRARAGRQGARIGRSGSALGAIVLLAALLAPRPAIAQIIAPEDAGRHVGEDVIVEGDVATVICSPLACLVSFAADYSGLAASIPGDVVSRFPPPKETYANRRVRVRGTIVDRNGRPRIEVTDPAALQVVGAGGAGSVTASAGGGVPVVRVDPSAGVKVTTDPPPLGGTGDGGAPVDAVVPPPPAAPQAMPPEAASATSRSRVINPGVVTSRLGGPRPPAAAEPRGESLVSRLTGGSADAAAVESRSLEQRIEQLQQDNANLIAAVQELEERLTVLEQSGGRGRTVNEEELPYTPDYVVSGDASTRLQTVKRGWSSERLLRAVGPPVNTVTEANGYMTWYYPNGRAVTLDPRGRVSSSVGF
jgi:hypothetical protein